MVTIAQKLLVFNAFIIEVMAGEGPPLREKRWAGFIAFRCLSDGVDCADHQRDITGKLVELNVHRHSRLISLKEDREVVVCPGIGVQVFQERIRINRRLGLVIVKIIYGFRKAVAAEAQLS